MGMMKSMKFNSLQKKAEKLHESRQAGKGNIKDEAAVLIELGQFYDDNRFDEEYPRAEIVALEYFRTAASLESEEANFICAQKYLDLGKFWDVWANGNYGRSEYRERSEKYFQDAFRALEQSEAAGNFKAKRLHGLVYIHGWGIEKDPKAGLQCILESIEMEKAWDRVTKILEELDLNTPEFYEALMTYKSSAPPEEKPPAEKPPEEK